MEDKQLINSITDALKASGFVGIQERASSRSLTLSGHRGERTVVLHFADPEPARGPRSGRNPDAPDPRAIVTRARVPTIEQTSGSGTGGPPP